MVDYLTRYYQGVYHLEHKYSDAEFKIFNFLKDSDQNFFLSLCSGWYMWNFLAGKIQGGTSLKIFVKKVTRGNAVQFFSNFPAKSLSIWREHFLMTPLYLIEFHLIN